MNLAQFQPHLHELRSRLIAIFVALLLSFAGCLAISAHIMDALFIPINSAMPLGGTMVFTALPEGFMTHLKIAFWAAMVISFPIILYEIWAFVAPGLYSHEKKWVKRFIFYSTALFSGGAAFGYFTVVPLILSFSMGFAGDGIQPMPRLQNYMVFILKTMLTMGLTFELPFAMALLSRSGIVDEDLFKKRRKTAYLALYTISIFLAPTDIFSQLMLTGPLIVMYEIGIRLSNWLS